MPLIDTIEQFFADEGWTTERGATTPSLRLRFQGKSGNWLCFARAIEDRHRLVFYSVCPVRIPDTHSAEIVEFITRANFGLIVGNFEYNYEDGELRFKTSIELGPDINPEDLDFAKLYGRLVGTNLSMMDKYLPGILDVLDNESPLLAIVRIEEGHPR